MNIIDYHNIINLTTKGIMLKSSKGNVFICFDDCVKNFSANFDKNSCKCVATRDITKLTFTFYTNPKTMIVFKKNIIKDFIMGKSALRSFFDLQKAIISAGYMSYDLS